MIEKLLKFKQIRLFIYPFKMKEVRAIRKGITHNKHRQIIKLFLHFKSFGFIIAWQFSQYLSLMSLIRELQL